MSISNHLLLELFKPNQQQDQHQPQLQVRTKDLQEFPQIPRQQRRPRHQLSESCQRKSEIKKSFTNTIIGVSIEVYSQRIGCHSNYGRKRTSSLCKRHNQNINSVSMSFITKLLLIFTIVCLQSSVPTAEMCLLPNETLSAPCNIFHPLGNVCSSTVNFLFYHYKMAS